MKLRPEVQRFAEAMERRLRANDHKGGWKHCDNVYLVTRLQEEASELDAAAERSMAEPFSESVGVRVVQEAADVANFAMMIADNYGDLMAEKREEKP